MSSKYIQAQTFRLYGSGNAIGDTTLTLTSFKQIDGTTNIVIGDFGTKGFMTLEPGNSSQEEQISFTGVTQNAGGTATLTGVKTVLFVSPYTETSGLAKAHPGGASCVISNTAGFYGRIATKDNDETISGTWTFSASPLAPEPTTDSQVATKKYVSDTVTGAVGTASEVTYGTTKLSVAPASAGVPIAVGDNDGRMPTTDEKAALAGTGTPAVGNKYVTQDTLAASSNPAGSLLMYGGASAPSGYLLCDGASYLRADYANLFTAIGTTYGSADGTHFNVPDFRGRAPIGAGTGAGGGAAGTGLPTGGSALTARALGAWTGEESHALVEAELASHAHTIDLVNGGTSGGVPSIANTTVFNNNGTTGASTINTRTTGSGTAHNTMQPVMTVNFIIKT